MGHAGRGETASKAALLVEDNSSHVVLIADELSSVLDGWRLDTAATVAEARHMMARHPYDLYVLDYMLPDGDGLGLLREIRGAGIDAPTLFVTTAASARMAVEAMRLGGDDYVVKEEGYLAMLPILVREVLDRARLAAERRDLEERLRRAERSATLGYLASGLAHHINNPLATVRTFLQLLPQQFADPEFRTTYLELVVSETDRIRDLVLEIMRATTVPAHGQEPFNLVDIVARAERNIGKELREKSVSCRCAIPSEMPRVRVHGEAAVCLFQTLLQNTVRFSPKNSTIEIDAAVDSDTHRVVTIVKDHGPGVPPEHRDRIFEPFFTTATLGLGMGLFVASRIADLQDVGLSLLPREDGGGAAFRVALPIA